MSKTFVPQPLIQSVMLALLFATLAACGGGGGGNAPTPTPTPTPVPDTSPIDFSFEPVTGAQRGEIYTASVTVSGINTATPVSVEGGLFAIGEGEWVEQGQVTNGQSITVQVTASDEFSTELTATLTVGDKSADFTVTTEAQDLEPEPFTFEGQADADFDTAYISNPITVSGINDATPISIEGGEFEIDGSGEEFTPVTEANAMVTAGQTARVRVTSASTVSETTQATLTIGNQTAIYSVTTFADTQAPVAEIAFPPPVSMTANTTLTVRGTVTDDYSEIESATILVNGAESPLTLVEDESETGLYHWSAEVTLTETIDNNLIITTADSRNNIDQQAASVMVRQGSLDDQFPDAENSIENIYFTVALDLTEEQRRIIAGSFNLEEENSSITIINLDTSEVLDDFAVEGLPQGYGYIAAITLDELSNYLYVSTIGSDGYAIARINPQTGEAETNSISFVRESNAYPGRVIIDRSGLEDRALFALPKDQIVYQADITLESYEEFSGPTTPNTDDPLGEPSDIVFCECGGANQFYVVDGPQATIVRVDAAGTREVFSSEGVDGTTGFNSANPKRSITLDSVGNRLLVSGADTNQIIEISLEGGERNTFSDDSTMSVWGFTDIITHPSLEYALVVDGESLSAIFAVDLKSGERVIISKSQN